MTTYTTLTLQQFIQIVQPNIAQAVESDKTFVQHLNQLITEKKLRTTLLCKLYLDTHMHPYSGKVSVQMLELFKQKASLAQQKRMEYAELIYHTHLKASYVAALLKSITTSQYTVLQQQHPTEIQAVMHASKEALYTMPLNVPHLPTNLDDIYQALNQLSEHAMLLFSCLLHIDDSIDPSALTKLARCMTTYIYPPALSLESCYLQCIQPQLNKEPASRTDYLDLLKNTALDKKEVLLSALRASANTTQSLQLEIYVPFDIKGPKTLCFTI